MKLTQTFQNQIQVLLAEAQTAIPAEEIYHDFRQGGLLRQGFGVDQFTKLFQPYFFAVLSQRWNRNCVNQGIESKEFQNLLFRSIIDRFAEQKDLEGATHYSEAMYASNSQPQEEPLHAILVAFFKKLEVNHDGTAGDTAEAFRRLAIAWEAYGNHFDNQFDDFIARLRLDGKVSGY